jgi:hypothetical protein
MKQNPVEKPVVTQFFKKFPAFYGTKRFITLFTRAAATMGNQKISDK